MQESRLVVKALCCITFCDAREPIGDVASWCITFCDAREPIGGEGVVLHHFL